MNKSTLYVILLFLVFGLITMVGSYQKSQIITFSQNGLQLTTLSKSDIILSGNKNDVFIIHNPAKQTTATYKIDSYFSGSSGVTILLNESVYGTQTDQELSVAAINGTMVFQETLKEQHYEDRKLLIEDVEKFQAFRLLQHQDTADIFSFIDDSPLIFLVIAFLLFFALWIQDFLVTLCMPILKDRSKLIVQLLLLTLVAYFLLLGTTPSSFAASKVSAMIRMTLIILPTYALFQYVLKHHIAGKDFPDQEFIKFISLFGGALVSILIGTEVARWVDLSFFGGSEYSMLSARTFRVLELMFAFTFAFANLLNNLRKYFQQLRGSEKLLQKSQHQALASEAELNALQASVNPHFLYNSLNSIASLATVDPPKTEQMALALSSFYEYATNREDKHLCSMKEEIQMIRNYLEIEKIRFGDRLQYDIQCSDEASQQQIPRFLLQPIVENAIKYGYNKQTDKIVVKVIAKMESYKLLLHIIDEGAPFSEEMKTGYGLRSTKKKLQLLYPGKYGMDLLNEPEKGVKIWMRA